MIACYVDDFFHSGILEFDRDVMMKLRERYSARKLEQGAFKYVGFQISRDDDDGLTLDQNNYINSIETKFL